MLFQIRHLIQPKRNRFLVLAKKLLWIFETPSTLTEEDFNPTRENDFGVKVEIGRLKSILLMTCCFGRSWTKGPENWNG
jgi:electron transfer flavoprotein alpha subunit